ncbi:hypothetical protein PPL_08790 [Heterostelium album PN500]|uniref:Uncharacterized protein n=1 Tax=Heterostelium pallidum (strain ATCC 26659 / Pp 5 / PN500) TaxID=670386 RepID=D3BJR1_HETP5|nr:hypothetical protein PPL_08790 [Heterostelium album PN500]EFA78141.1 hypothetical protein PPL_08790 [Heterostelium album PN500]|eukprot:XP_020430267.1 hypothetical protein PPL_08790 [Heterostelium album PN500]
MMKINNTFLILIVGLVCLVDLSVQSNFIYITPYSSDDVSSTPYGIGYNIPMDTCLTVNGIDVMFHQADPSSNNVTMTEFLDNCTTAHTHYSYRLDEVVGFNLFYGPKYNATLSLKTNAMPSDAVQYIYYYYSNFCSGPTYTIYFTNGYSDSDGKYFCNNDEPQVFACYNGNCVQVTFDHSLVIGLAFLVDLSTQTTLSYIYITPYGSNETAKTDTPNGVGYIFPMDTCLDMNTGTNILFHQEDPNSNSVTMSRMINYCTTLVENFTFTLDEMTTFNIIYGPSFYSTLSLKTNNMPSDAIQFSYYYDSRKTCVGPTYTKYYTNGYSTSTSKYYCNNNVPAVFSCSDDNCTQLNYSGCNSGFFYGSYIVHC